MTKCEGTGHLLPASAEKLWSDLCTVEPTIFILIKNLSLQAELWSRSLENSWQWYELNGGHQNKLRYK